MKLVFATVTALVSIIIQPCLAAIPGKPTNKAACMSIVAYGAISNGADATRAIQNAISAAKQTTARCVYVPAGTYNMTRIVVDGGVKMIGDGVSSVLFAPNPDNRQVKIAGSQAGIYSLEIKTIGTRRTNVNEGIWIESGATNFVIDHVTIDGGNGPGIITYGGSYGRITSNRVLRTKSDAIHLSGGAHNIYVAGNIVRYSEDDMIAVVTYDYHPVNTYQILIENNDLANQSWGRGVSVVGGENVTVRNNKINKPADAAIYLAAEGAWHTRGVRNVRVENNVIDRAPYAHPEHGQSSILVFSDEPGFYAENIALVGNAITNAVHQPIRVQPYNVRNVGCTNNTYQGAPTTASNCTAATGAIAGTAVTGYILGGSPVPLPNPS